MPKQTRGIIAALFFFLSAVAIASEHEDPIQQIELVDDHYVINVIEYVMVMLKPGNDCSLDVSFVQLPLEPSAHVAGQPFGHLSLNIPPDGVVEVSPTRFPEALDVVTFLIACEGATTLVAYVPRTLAHVAIRADGIDI